MIMKCTVQKEQFIFIVISRVKKKKTRKKKKKKSEIGHTVEIAICIDEKVKADIAGIDGIL